MSALLKRTFILVAIAGLVLSAPGYAASDTEAGRNLVERFLSDVRTLTGSFQQSVIDADGTVLDSSAGTIDIERPGRFRWTTSEPFEQWLVADGLNVWSYDVDLAQVTVKAQDEALENTPALLLGGDSGALDDFVVEAAETRGDTTWVRLVPVDTSSGFREVELGFVGDMLSRMVFLDTLEQQTVVALNDLRYNEELDAGRFEFTVPDDVDVVGTPATAPVVSATDETP